MERAIERVVLLAMFSIYAMVGRELWHVGETIATITDIDLVVVLCSVLDLVLLANLMVMVAVSSYESYVTRIDRAAYERPEWLGKLDSGNVKVKVAVSVAMISAIHLLRGFLRDDPDAHLMVLAGVHMVFVLSALAVALVDRTGRHAVEASHG